MYQQTYLYDLLGGIQRCKDWWHQIRENDTLRGWIDETGFGDILRALPHYKSRSSKTAVTALIERWNVVTHTFHLPVGEMTITPSDIVALTGLP